MVDKWYKRKCKAFITSSTRVQGATQVTEAIRW
jgi:hypothetical protein